jgi:hypothetical protein
MTPSTSKNFSLLKAAAAAAAGLLLCSAVAGAGQQRDWPTLPTPENLEAFAVGNQTQLNGIPVRIQGYVSDRSISELNHWYRQKVGGQWVENKIGSKTVLGQRRGDYFVTIEFESMLGTLSGSTTKVVTAIMDLRRPAAQPTPGLDAFGNWASRLPVTSQVMSHMTDSSSTNESVHLVAVNGQSQAFNAQHFRREFLQMGYRVEADSASKAPQDALRGAGGTGMEERLLFSAPNTDAVVVLGRDDKGRSTVVLIINRSKR